MSRRLVEAYNAVLNAYDLLLMPTLPMPPTPLQPATRRGRSMCSARWR